MFGSSEADRLRAMLVDYNRADLVQLVHVTRRVRDLATGTRLAGRGARTRLQKCA